MVKNRISVIGAAIIDILAGAVDSSVFSKGSTAMDHIVMSFGGDALNEAVVMSRLGLSVEIITKVGGDEAGRQVIDYLQRNKVACKYAVDSSIDTGMNIVLVDKAGERSFLTNPQSSLRKLSLEDIEEHIDDMGDIVCFASMFVSPLLDVIKMEKLFELIKNIPERRLVVDMTTAKNGETLEDIRPLLKYVDFLIPNEFEAGILTGNSDVVTNAKLLHEAGAKCVVIKCGSNGCVICSENELLKIPALKGINVLDTTGAGDGFAAGFVWGLNNNMSLKECGQFANAVSSCIVEKMGAHTAITSIEEPMQRYDRISQTDCLE